MNIYRIEFVSENYTVFAVSEDKHAALNYAEKFFSKVFRKKPVGHKEVVPIWSVEEGLVFGLVNGEEPIWLVHCM